MCAKSRRLIALVKVAKFNRILHRDAVAAPSLGNRHVRLPERTWPSSNTVSDELKPTF
jgi:hypothetical protein